MVDYLNAEPFHFASESLVASIPPRLPARMQSALEQGRPTALAVLLDDTGPGASPAMEPEARALAAALSGLPCLFVRERNLFNFLWANYRLLPAKSMRQERGKVVINSRLGRITL